MQASKVPARWLSAAAAGASARSARTDVTCPSEASRRNAGKDSSRLYVATTSQSRGRPSSTFLPMNPDAPVTSTFIAAFSPGVFAIPVDRHVQPLVQAHLRLVVEEPAGLGDVGHADLDFRARVRLEDDLRLGAREPDQRLGEPEHRGGGLRVADVEHLALALLLRHRADEGVGKVGHVAPGADLRAVVE